MEESEGRIDAARSIYESAVNKYVTKRGIKSSFDTSFSDNHKKKKKVRPLKLGDKWIKVYKSWARMEENYGTYKNSNIVYGRAALAFPHNWKVLVEWAQLQITHKHAGRARSIFELACDRVGNK